MPTLGSLVTDISTILNDSSVPETRIKSAINSTIDSLETYGFWFQQAMETYTLTAGANLLGSDPTNFSHEFSRGGLTIQDGTETYPLKKVHLQEYDWFNAQNNARPLVYTRLNEQFLLYPFPDQAYTAYLRYFKTYSDLVNDGDTNDFTDNAARLVKYQTLADLFIDERKSTERYNDYKARADMEMRRLTKQSGDRRGTKRTTPDGVMPTYMGRLS